MTAKLFEIRDLMTTISALAVKLESTDDAERFLLAHAGFGLTHDEQARYVVLLRLGGSSGEWTCDPHSWSPPFARTMPIAQQYINAHFDELQSGAVVDVQFILGETANPKISERVTYGA